MKKTELQDIAFRMIGIIGQAKFMAKDAYVQYKKNKNKDDLIKKLKEAETKLGEVGKIHMDVVTAEAQGDNIDFSTIFLHAEDQFMTVQMMIDILLLVSED